MSHDQEIGSLPILQQLGDAPRDVPFAVRLYLRLYSSNAASLSMFGWIFAGFVLICPLFAVTVIGLDDVIPQTWVDAGKGKITSIEATDITDITDSDNRVYAYHFETTDNGREKVNGISYGYEGKYKTDDEVSLQKAGARYRIQGLTQTPGGWTMFAMFFGVGSLLAMFGLCFPVYSWFDGGKAIDLLRNGTVTTARFRSMNATDMRFNGSSVINVDFEYQVEGEPYTASARVLDTSRLTNTMSKTVIYDPIKGETYTASTCKAVFYDPMQPSQSIVLDGLPSGLHLDELTGRFSVNPMRCVLPLLAATVVFGEIVAIIVFAIRAI